MKKYEFYAECGERLIDISVALENENLREALKNEDDEKIIEILDTEF